MNIRNRDSIERLTTNQIILRSKNGSVKISIDDSGILNFSSANNRNTGSFSIDLKNDKISIKSIQFKNDSSSLTSSSGIGSGTNIADSKFDPTTGKLLDDNLSTNIKDLIDKGVVTRDFFDTTGKLKEVNFNENLKENILLGVGARNFFDTDGKLKDTNFNDALKADIQLGVGARNFFDTAGKLKDVNFNDILKADINKGVTAHGRFDIDGKLLDDNLSNTIKTNITKGVDAYGKFDGSTGKLLDDILSTTIKTNITKGTNAYDDLGNLDFSVDTTNPDAPIIKLSRGARGVSSTTLTKSSIGLGNAENKNSQQIRNEITVVGGVLSGIGTSNIKVDNESAFGDSRFTTVQSNAINGLSAYNDLGNLDFSVDNTNPAIPIIKLSRGSRGVAGTSLTKSSIGLANAENKSSQTIREEITVDANGALQGIGSGAGSVVNNSKITVSNGILTGIGTSNIKVDNEFAFSDNRYLLVSGSAVSGVLAHNDLNTADISIDANGLIKFNRGGSRGSSIGATVTKSHVGLANVENKSSQTIRQEITVVGGVLTGIGTSNIKVDNESAFSDSRFTTVQTNATNGSTAFGYFNSGLLKDANTPEGLKNSNLSLSQASDGTITFARGSGISSLSVNPLTTSTFTNLQNTANNANTTANTIEARFSNGRIKEENSLNKRPKIIQYGQSMPTNPEVGDLVTVLGNGNFIGTTYVYGVREYDVSKYPGDSNWKSFFSPNKTATWNTYLNPYFTRTSTSTGVVKYEYDSKTLSVYEYSLFINPNSSIYSIDKFYGQTKFTVRYIPVTGSTYYKSNYTPSDVGNDGTTGDPALYFKVEDTSSPGDYSSYIIPTVYNASNNASLGQAVSDWDGTYSTESIYSGLLYYTYKYKEFTYTHNENAFYGYGITHSNTTDATTNRRILVEKIKIEGWVPYDDTGIKSRLYELAQKTSITFDTFTGQHKCVIDKKENINLYKTGLIVSSTGIYNNMNYENSEFENKITPQEAVPVVKLSNKIKEKNVLGVICKEWEMSKYNNKNFKADGMLIEQSDNKRFEINSLGEGGIWICNINGNLENGDYITTCEISGYGMKQDDDLLHNYTVAKITCDCDFNLESPIYICEEFEFEGKTYRKAFVGCTYHCG